MIGLTLPLSTSWRSVARLARFGVTIRTTSRGRRTTGLHHRPDHRSHRSNQTAAARRFSARQNQCAIGFDHAAAVGQRAIANQINQHVVAHLSTREVLAPVVDHVVRTERAHQVHVAGTANSGHFRAECLCDLNGERAYAARRTIDQDVLTGPELRRIA